MNNITFGTAGIRGIISDAANGMNTNVIEKVTMAFSIFLNKKFKNPKIAVVNDNRNMGFEFNETVRKILSSQGIEVHYFDDVLPTPFLSWYIRKHNLSGGINITASHNPKEYNGYKVYGDDGAQIGADDSKIIEKNIGVPLKETKNVGMLKKINVEAVDEYINDISCLGLKSNESIAYSPLSGTGYKIGTKVLSNLFSKVNLVEKQGFPDKTFKNIDSPNPEDSSSYAKLIKVARKTNSKIAVLTDPDSDRLGIVSKHKKIYKLITGNEFASLYAYMLYKKNELKDKKVITSFVSTKLVEKIVNKAGGTVDYVNVGFKNIANKMKETKYEFAFEESYGVLLDQKLTRDKDAFQGFAMLSRIIDFYGTDLYKALIEIHKEFGIVTNRVQKYGINQAKYKVMIKDMKINSKIYNNPILKKTSEFGADKFHYKNYTVITRKSGTEDLYKFYIECTNDNEFSNEKEHFDQLSTDVIVPKIIDISLEEAIADKSEKKFTLKGFIKYSIFALIAIGIMYFTFEAIYSNFNSQETLWKNVSFLFNSHTRFIWLLLWVSFAISTSINAVIKLRILRKAGEKVKFRHIVISAFMGSIISFITPLAIGGDAIGYWYLKRKGFRSGPLIASFISGTIIYQISLVTISLMLIPLGLPIYKSLFFSDDPQSKIAFIMFLVGISWNVFASFMIFSLFGWRRMQNFIFRNSISLLQWFSFIRNRYDNEYYTTRRFDLIAMRNTTKTLWSSKRFILELLFYEHSLKFLTLFPLVFIIAGVIGTNYGMNPYISLIVTEDIIGTANSLSITPGGSGTNEWLKMNVNNHTFKDVFGTGSQDTVAAMDVLVKLTFTWPELVASALLIINIIILERNKLKKDRKLRNKVKLASLIMWISIFSIYATIIGVFL